LENGQDSANLERLIKSLMRVSDDYKQVCFAINEKKRELKEVYDISIEADTYVALVQAKENIKNNKEIEALKIIEDASAKAKVILDNAHEKEQSIAQQIQNSINEYNTESQRKKEEFEYMFEREKKLKTDKLNDTLASKGKSLDERESEIKVKEENIKEMELKIENLEDALDKVKLEKDTQVKKEVEICSNNIVTVKNHEIDILKTKHVASLAIKENETRMLTTQINDLNEQVAVLQNAVDNASKRLTSIATASLDAKANESKVDAVMEAIKNSNQQGKR